jgi:amino acid permease
MSVSSNDSRYSSRRASSIARVASSIRASAASVVDAVEEQIEVGTIGGTVLNTTCNVIGAGVLSLPLACHNASIGFTVILNILVAIIGAFSAYVLFVGCDRTGAYFMNEVFAISLIGKPKRRDVSSEPDEHAPRPVVMDPNTPLVPTNRPTTRQSKGNTVPDRISSVQDEVSEVETEDEKRKNFMRMVLSLIVDGIIFINNYIMLAIYTRIIIDSIPPVIANFFHAGENTIWTHKLTWLLIAAVIFFALTSVRNFAELKWSSILGIGTIMYTALVIIIEYGKNGYQAPAPRVVRDFGVYPQFAAAIATLSVAYGYHFNAPAFYHELHDRTPRRMMKTVAISFPIIAVTYLTVAILGYLSFGSHVNDKSAGGVITNNYGKENVLVNTARLGLFFHFVCVFPVMSVCVRHSLHRFVLTFIGRRVEAIHPDMPARVPRPMIVAEAFFLVATSALLAYFDSNVGLLIEYVGAVCGATMMFTIPGIIGCCIWADVGGLASSSEVIPLTSTTVVRDPPPHHHRRKLMRGLCVGLILIGIASTMASLATT